MSALSPVVLFEFQLLDHASSRNLYCGFTASLNFCGDLFQLFCVDVQPSELFSCLKKHKNEPEMERRYFKRLAVHLFGS